MRWYIKMLTSKLILDVNNKISIANSTKSSRLFLEITINNVSSIENNLFLYLWGYVKCCVSLSFPYIDLRHLAPSYSKTLQVTLNYQIIQIRLLCIWMKNRQVWKEK